MGPDRVDGVRTVQTGPGLAFHLNRRETEAEPGLCIQHLLRVAADRGLLPDWLMLSFGEIDIRIHIVRQAIKRQVSLRTVVRDVIDEYASFMRAICSFGPKLLVWGPPPPCGAFNFIADYPVAGSHEERASACLVFTEELAARACAEQDLFRVVTMLPSLVAEDGTSRSAFYQDNVHVSNAALPFALDALEAVVGWRPNWVVPPGRFDSWLDPDALPTTRNIAPHCSWRIVPSATHADASPNAPAGTGRRSVESGVGANPRLFLFLRASHMVVSIRVSFSTEEDAISNEIIVSTSVDERIYTPVPSKVLTIEKNERIYNLINSEVRAVEVVNRGQGRKLCIDYIEINAYSYK